MAHEYAAEDCGLSTRNQIKITSNLYALPWPSYLRYTGPTDVKLFRFSLFCGKSNHELMGHLIDAIVGKAPINEDMVHKYGLAVAYESGYAIIFLDREHIYYWSEKLNSSIDSKSDKVDWDCELVHFWVAELGLSKFAIIHTDYFGGIGEQSASLYEGDEKIMSDVSINETLQGLGVDYSSGSDPFDILKLGNYRYTEQYYWGAHNQAVDKKNMIAGKPFGRYA